MLLQLDQVVSVVNTEHQYKGGQVGVKSIRRSRYQYGEGRRKIRLEKLVV